VLGALLSTTLFGLTNDVYFQVGLLTTIGLSSKNAILSVEFARDLQHHEGMKALDAAIEAAKMRLRPILMTSLAFLLGVLPLAIASGAGSASQNSIGTGVIGGTLAATFLATFMIPMFFVVVLDKLTKEKPDAPADKPGSGDGKAGPAVAPATEPA
jgi:multidrug efflux pump